MKKVDIEINQYGLKKILNIETLLNENLRILENLIEKRVLDYDKMESLIEILEKYKKIIIIIKCMFKREFLNIKEPTNYLLYNKNDFKKFSLKVKEDSLREIKKEVRQTLKNNLNLLVNEMEEFDSYNKLSIVDIAILLDIEGITIENIRRNIRFV